MGNQGTKNWKLTALFAISLMLIAGLFTNAAIARDGSGTASVTWNVNGASSPQAIVFRGNDVLYEHNTNTGGAQATATFRPPLPAGSTENQLMFSYRVDTNMAGGEVEFSLRSGAWKIITKLTDIKDADEKVADGATDDPYDRYGGATLGTGEILLVEVREYYGRTAPAIDAANASFGIRRDEKATQVNGTAFPDTLPTDNEDVSIQMRADHALSGRVTVDATSVLVKLSNEWRSGGEVVVVLRNVQTAVPRSLTERPVGVGEAPYHSYPVTVKSKRSGRLDLLDPVRVDLNGDDIVAADEYTTQPAIRVGNILGTRTDDSSADGVHHYGPDQIARNFTITPDVAYEGETDETFKVSFEANGPMYSTRVVDPADPDKFVIGQQASIVIIIPQELQDRTADGDDAVPLSAQNVSVIARGRVLPSGNLNVVTAGTEANPEVVISDSDNRVTINLDRIDDGATITLTYHLRGQDNNDGTNSDGVLEVAGDGVDDLASLISVSTTVDDAVLDMMVSAFEIETVVPTAAAGVGPSTAATLITGGQLHSQAGSGTMTMTAPSDNQVEAGDKISTITLVYKAATVLMDVDLSVDVKGIVLTNDPDTEDVTEELGDSTYGVVSYRGNFSPTQEIEDPPGEDTKGNASATITWEGLDFTKAGQTFTIDIKNVIARDEGGAVEFTTRVSEEGDLDGFDSGDDLAKSPKLYITDTQDGAVEFKIDDQSFVTYSAGQELDTIVFSFEAVSTAIKGGQVKFTLPTGWTDMKPPSTTGADKILGEVSIGGASGFALKADSTKDIKKTPITISSGTATVGVPNLAIGGKITITINNKKVGDDGVEDKITVQDNATDDNEPETIDGFFWTSGSRGRGYSAGKVEVEVTNVADGYGTATIEPKEVSAGSNDQEITVDFTAVGSMDDGAVRLVIPDDWGDLQDEDATKANYVEVDVVEGRGSAEANVADRAVIANLTGVQKGSVVRFTYGGGTVTTRNGAEVQPSITTSDAPAEFIIETDGDGNGSFSDVRGVQLTKVQVTENSDDKTKTLGAVSRDAYAADAAGAGLLRIAVTGADDGSGNAEVEIVATAKGEGEYPDDLDSNGNGNRTEVLDDLMRIHAGDMGTYLKFTYTPDQTIESGQLKFKTQGEWSAPFNSPGTPGYTYFTGTGAADIGNIEFDESDDSVTVDIDSIDSDSTIEIHYGAYEGDDDGSGAQAPSAATTSSVFYISVKGGDGVDNKLDPIKTLKRGPIVVPVYSQASGGGNVKASVSDNKNEGNIGAGDTDREVTVVYTAAGEISDGSLKLTIPAGWSHPTMDNVEITTRGAINLSSALYGGAYVGDPDDDDDDDFPVDADDVALLTAVDVTVGGVNLDAGDTVTFVYSAAMVQPGAGDPKFDVAVDGGSGPGEGTAAVTPDPADATTIAVGDASPGSGKGMIQRPLAKAVTIGSPENTLTFTYTATGAITDRRLDIRVKVPAGWSAPTDREDADARGSFEVDHKKLDADGDLVEQTAANAAVEKLGPFDREMAARLTSSGSLAAGDQVIFTYQNADAPSDVGPSTFTMFYGGEEVKDADLTVLVGSGKDATALDVSVSPDMILREDDESVTVTVTLQDEDGNDVPATEDMEVGLVSSNVDTGSFMVDGEAEEMVTITAGSSSAMADYTDSTIGAATITASSGTLTAGTATVTVSTDVVEVTFVDFTITDSDGVTRDIARDGDTITVTAMATPGKEPTVTIGNLVDEGAIPESPDSPGTYTRSDTLAMGTQDGTHAVTVNLGDASGSADDMIMVDNTAPTVTASASPAIVANGDTVTISAVVTGDATSVMANVSLLDIGATSVALTDADADGTYTYMHTISADNVAANGEQLITVTAMDAAGNSSDTTTTVTLLNTLSFTSTLPQGISLFHVPLDEEGLDTVGDLETKLGANVNLLITYDGTSWNSRSDDVMITASLGILVSMSAETAVTFDGHAWADGSISLAAGSNLIGLPLNDARVTNVSDISGLFGAGVVTSVIVSSGGEFQLVAAPGDAADGPVTGDAAYLVMASAAGSATLSGDGWSNGEMAGAAPIALAGYTVDNQTPVLDVLGSVVDEITGLAKEGFRVKVKNLSTKAALSNIIAVEASEGYNMTFVDLADSYAARVGDVLEISADSPDPLLGIKPVRHIVTVDDVKSTRIQLEDLIAYEIPAETELLRNYPNPFNPETWIPYRLAEDADVSLTIYDTSGALVRSIDLGHQTAAVYETRAKAIYWDGRNRFGEQVASGIYFYSLSTGDFSATRKMVILK